MASKTSRPGRFYGLSKIHKPGILIRPIGDYTPYGTYMLAKYLNSLLKSYGKIVISKINDAIDFAHFTKIVKLESDETAISFDVTSLYTRRPV